MIHRPILYVMIGLPASGKSTIAQHIKDYENAQIVSSDGIRKELYGDENIQGNPNEVFFLMQTRMVEFLSKGEGVVYDATNLTMKSRSFLRNYKPLNAIRDQIDIVGIMCVSPFKDCCERNSKRARTVPMSVMERMYKQFTPPMLSEGFDRIKIHHVDTEIKFNILNDIQLHMNYNQNNPYHLETLGEHLNWCYTEMLKITSKEIAMMGLYHDIGKPYCRTTDEEGVSHYFGHDTISSYLTLCYGCYDNNFVYSDKEILLLANLVRWHMQLYCGEFSNNQKSLFGEEFINTLRSFNEIDKVARQRNDIGINYENKK